MAVLSPARLARSYDRGLEHPEANRGFVNAYARRSKKTTTKTTTTSVSNPPPMYMISLLFLKLARAHPWSLRVSRSTESKKPTRRNALRNSTTSAYSSTSPPAKPGCSLSSRPTTSNSLLTEAACNLAAPPPTTNILPRGEPIQGK